ncbi:MAG: ankyrin repeat domain-containing protein [Treponema sp.]|nr:ankyrin repeat domain-containing protein [Treponema sp.]
MNKKIALLSTAAISLFMGCQTTQAIWAPESPQALIKAGKIAQAKEKFQTPNDINSIDAEGNTVLHMAAMINDADLITFFIIKGADPELKNNAGDTPLHVAVKNSSFDAAKNLAAMGANIFARDSEGITALDLGLANSTAYYELFITTKTGEIRDVEGKTIVHYFVETDNLKGIQACINKGIPISIKDDNGNTPLDLAFSKMDDLNAVEIAAELIQSGADDTDGDFTYFQNAVASRNLNSRFDDGQTPLHYCSILGHIAIAEYLLINNADTSAQDSAGATPLHEAIRYGNLEIAKLLLDSGANVNAKDNLGKTPIMLIPPMDKVEETYPLLISYNADLNQKDMYGDTVLHTATMMKVNTYTIQEIISGGADVNARNKEGVTPLEIAIQQNDLYTVQLLTSNRANIHTQDTHGMSPLMLALRGSNEIFSATLNKQNVESQDSDGNTPLHIALLNDAAFSKVQYIVSLTDDVNLRNRDGNSALFISVMKNRQKVGEILLAKNADIFSTNINNNSPLRIALKFGGSVQDWLLTARTIRSTDGSGNTVLHYAAEWEYLNAINSLLTKGADINARNANGETCLFSAAKTDNPDIIQAIIDGGASIKDRDNLGNTPLHIAVRWDAVNASKKLLDLGMNINAQNSAGNSPLAEAVIASKYRVSKFLIDNGADTNSCDRNGVTILMDTIRTNNKDIVKLLLDSGASPNLQEINGRNAYHEAAYMGDVEIINLIRNAGGNALSRDKQGNTPFSIVLNKEFSIIKAILGKSFNITDSDGNSPIHIIVKNNGSPGLLKTLYAEGFPIDTRNANGYTPLNYAIETDNLSLATILLENGANPFQTIDKKGRNGVSIALEKKNTQMLENIVKYANSMTDIQGNTILHYAAKSSPADIIKTLLSYGIDTNVKNVSGDTPYTIAIRWKRPEIAALLASAEK